MLDGPDAGATPEAVLSEVARVLRPGGVFIALVPSRRPLNATDTARYTRLLAALRTRHLDYPNEGLLDDGFGDLLRRHRLRPAEDERRRFRLPDYQPVRGRDVCAIFVPARCRRAPARGWRTGGQELGGQGAGLASQAAGCRAGFQPSAIGDRLPSLPRRVDRLR